MRAGRGFASVAPWREVFGIDLRTLALFRVFLGLYLIADLVLRARDLSAHYTDFGIMPRDLAQSFLWPSSVSVHLANGGAVFQAALFALAGVFALMLVVGWRTRLATIASWALLMSLQNRNPLILSGEDNLAILLLFWAMFLPIGGRFSVDAALDSRAARPPDAFCSIASAGLLIQGMSMYFFSALLKSDPIWIPEGTAVYYALNLDYFATPFALWFRQFDGMMRVLTYGVWTLELVGPVLMFSPILHRPLRGLLMGCFIFMHLGFWMCLEIGMFPVISIIMNLTFMPGWMWDALERRLTPDAATGLRIWYDRDCAFCRKACRIIATFLCLGEVPIRPAQDDPRIGGLLEASNSWVVTDRGADHLGWQALCRLVAGSPLARPLAGPMRWPVVARAGDRVYRRIAAHRPRLAKAAANLLPLRPLRVKPSRLGRLLAASALVFVTVQNLSTLPAASIRLPDGFRAVRQSLGLYQHWTMFAPYPEVTSPWPVIRGVLADGTVVDVYNRRLGPPPSQRPEVVSAVYANGRWRKFLSQLEDESYMAGPHELARSYARFLCRSWNRGQPDGRHLGALAISFQVEWTNPPGTPKDLETNLVLNHDCLR